MIRDLLELFRITRSPRPRPGSSWARWSSGRWRRYAPQIAAKGVRVEIGPLPRVGVKAQAGHVVSNLLGNAVKYVAAEQGEIAGGRGRERQLSLSVRDNGIGIPPAYHRGIFELLRTRARAEQEVDGRAVGARVSGLAIVKRIVEAPRGSVAVESAPGAGSCFTGRLPAGGGGSHGRSRARARGRRQSRLSPRGAGRARARVRGHTVENGTDALAFLGRRPPFTDAPRPAFHPARFPSRPTWTPRRCSSASARCRARRLPVWS